MSEHMGTLPYYVEIRGGKNDKRKPGRGTEVCGTDKRYSQIGELWLDELPRDLSLCLRNSAVKK